MLAGRGLATLLLLGGLTTLGPKLPDTAMLLREGNAAFEGGDHARAVSLYEQAEARASDPGLVAFNLASAKYHLAVAREDSGLLREAEGHYRCCLGSDDPRRARALYGLGNCLLRRASGADDLRAALKSFKDCLRAGADEDLARDARYNLQRARLLLAQALSQGTPKDNPGDEENPPPEKGPSAQEQSGGENGGPENQSGATPVKAKPGEKLLKAEHDMVPPGPGAGNLPPVPDRADLPPLSPEDAAAHLRQAARLILEERQAYRKGKRRPVPAGVRDW